MFAIVIPAIKIPSRKYISVSDAASVTANYKLTPNLVISLIKENGECYLITNQSSTKINIVCE